MSIAKTVSYSPLRPNTEKASFKNALDNPLRAKWPIVSEAAIEKIRNLLDSSLNGLKVAFSHTQTVRRPRRSRRKRKVDMPDDMEPKAKRVCSETNDEQSFEISKTPVSPSLQDQSPILQRNHPSAVLPEPTADRLPKEEVNMELSEKVKAKKDQLVVGVNAVTRQLEQGKVEAGLVCSTSPGLLYQHILPLAATREVPFAAVPDLGKTLARLLGIKKSMCIAWKKSESTSQFSELTNAVTNFCPSLKLSWLTPVATSEKQNLGSEESASLKLSPLLTRHVAAPDRRQKDDRGVSKTVGVVFSPLQVKKTKCAPNPKRRRGKRSRKSKTKVTLGIS